MHLFSPLAIRDVTFRNRIAVSPMCQYSSEDGFATDWHLVHLGSRAVGGAGLVITEAAAVEARGRISPHDLGIYQDGHIEPLRRMNRFMRDHGAASGVQLAHAGRKASTARPWEGGKSVGPEQGGWSPLVGPSALPFSDDYQTPEALDLTEIGVIVQAFRTAAKRALEAEYDVIEIHGAHGYLLHEFLSPQSNQRTDEYGGDLAQRSRFAIELIQAVRAAVGPDFPIIFRYSQWKQQDYTARLVQTPEALEAFLKPLSDAGVDIFHCSTRRFWEPEFEGSDLNLAGWTRKLTGKPTITVGSVGLDGEFLQFMVKTDKVAQPASLENLLKRLGEDEFDLVAVGRALLVDPDWAVKVRDGREEDILPFSRDALGKLE